MGPGAKEAAFPLNLAPFLAEPLMNGSPFAAVRPPDCCGPLQFGTATRSLYGSQ
jgi:hypothetical protein